MLSRDLRRTAWLVALGAALSACDGVGLLRGKPSPGESGGGGPSSSGAGGSGASNGCPEAGPPAAPSETAFYLWSYDGAGAVIQWSPTRQIVLANILDSAGRLTVMRDATKLAFGQSTGSHHILQLATGNPSSPEVIAELERFPGGLQYSPDGRWLAYTLDEYDGEPGLWVIPACGGLPKQLFDGAVVGAFAWQPDTADDAARIVLHSDSLYAVDASATIPTPVDLLNGVSATIADGVPVFDAVGQVYFRADMEADGALRLYRAALDGTKLEEVPQAAGFTHGGGPADIGAIGISDDGYYLAFAVDTPTEHLFQLYIAPLAGGAAGFVTSIAIPQPADDTGPDPTAPIVWSNDSLHLAVRADWPLPDTVGDDYWSAFVVPTNSTGPVRVFKSPGSFDAGARQIAFSSNSARVFTSGRFDATTLECWALTTADFTIPDQNIAPIHQPPEEGRCEIVAPP